MGRFADEDIARVRDATDLVSLVSETVVLKQKGRLFWGNCPFHGEKTPSFKIDPTTQLWHCFGCNRGGDAFGYVMEAEHLEFPDAVRRLAERSHVELVEVGGAGIPAGRKERLIAASTEAAAFFHRLLTSDTATGPSQAREYLADRGFGIDVAKRWTLGYAPHGRDTLVRHMLDAGFTREELVDANLALADGASLKDRFFNRIMFPINDLHGRTIAFGGRVVGKGEPKYLNSQETPIFQKSGTLYGLDRSRNEIVTDGTAVVVEGYTDVIALHEAGIRTAVATLGTALTERHVKLLGRFGKRVVYLFDGDVAGQRAALRAAEFLDWGITPEAGSARVDLDVAIIPGGMDPADLVSRDGTDAVRAIIEGAEPLLRFAIDRHLEEHDLEHPEGRSAALVSAAAVLAPVHGSLLAQDYIMHIAGRLGTDYATVERAVPHRSRQGETKGSRTPVSEPVRLGGAEERAEREIVRLAALAPSVRVKARKLLADGAVGGERARALLEVICTAGDAVGEDLYRRVAEVDREAATVLSGWLVDATGVEQVDYAFREVSVRVQEFALGRLITQKKGELQEQDPATNAESYDRLFGEIAELQRQQAAIKRPHGADTNVEAE
ncbi:MAG: DNA primase [Coriobacteriia bacterium]|nr:DNA primase [Coriobacteriia bacterium]